MHGTPLGLATAAKRTQLLTKHAKWGLSDYSIGSWLAAQAMVWSRCFELPTGDVALVPVLEILNHESKNPNASWEFDQDTGSIIVTASQV